MKPTRDGEGVASDKTSKNLPYPNPNIERDKVEEIRTTTIQLDTIARVIAHWLEWQEHERSSEGLSSDEDTHVMRVPTWPTRGMFGAWIATLKAAESLLTVSEKKRAEDANEARTVLANALRAAIDERDGFIATIERLESAAKQSRSSLMRVREALKNLMRAAATEVVVHGAGCTAGYLEAEDKARSALQASGDG